MNTASAAVSFVCVGPVEFTRAVLSKTGRNSFQGLVGQLSGVGGVALMFSLDSSEDSLVIGFLMALNGDQPGGRLNLVKD